MSLVGKLGKAAAITAVAGTFGGASLLAAQAVAAKTRRYARPDLRLAMRTTVGPTRAPTLRLVLLGDSSALGVGVERVTDTVGGHLAELLAGAQRDAGTESHLVFRVELSSVAVSGSRSADLATQVARALLGPAPDVAVILIGANDATNLRGPATAAAALAAAVTRLASAGVAVVVGTCPDLGAVRAIARPLRHVVAWQGRRVGRAQQAATLATGGIPVDLAAQTGPVFRADPGTLCTDGYHPSADGYRVWAHALYPAVALAAAQAVPHH
jgi:lysophospholipase L1-like esterase